MAYELFEMRSVPQNSVLYNFTVLGNVLDFFFKNKVMMVAY